MTVTKRESYRVLVVDDDPAIRETYSQILQPKGSEVGALEALISGMPATNLTSADFEVIQASQGEQAEALQKAALARGCPLQLAFIDMRMPPGWDGMQTAVALRAQDPSIYIVIATAFSDYDVNELQRVLGHDVVMLRKPFTREEVFQLARTLCQSWQTRHRLESVTAEMERQVQERTVELNKRIAQRQALAEIATHCIELLPDDDPDDAVHWSLARIGRVTGSDAAGIFCLDQGGASYSLSHEWLALGMSSFRERFQGLPETRFRLPIGRLRRGETFGFSRLEDLQDATPDAIGDLRQRLAGQIESLLTVPVESAGRMIGFVAIGCRHAGSRWDEHDETLLRTAGHIVFRTLEVHEAKRRLSESEARYFSLLQSIPSVVYRCALDAHWTIQFMSNYIETLCGYPLSDFIDNNVRSYASIIHPHDRDRVDAAVRAGVVQHAPYNIEYRIVHVDGTVRWVVERGQASYDRQGQVLWLDGVINDISARKRLEMTLAATAEFVSRAGGDDFFPALVRHVGETLQLDHVHIALSNSDSTRVQTLAVWQDGRIIQNISYDLVDTPCREVLQLARQCIESGVQAQFPHDVDLTEIGAESYVGEPLVDSAGQSIGLIVGITRSPLPDGDMVQANLRILAARAAAEWTRQEAMRSLQRERDTKHNILHTVEAIIVALDCDGRITLINRKGCELLGYEESELLGQDWFTTCLPANLDLQAVRSVFRKALANDLAGSEYYENPVRLRSGEQRLIAWHNSSIRDGEGNIIGGLSAGEDITERKDAEERLRASEERFHKLFEDADALAIQGYLMDGEVVFWNRASEQLYGYTAAEALGRKLSDLIIPESLQAAFRDTVCLLAENNQRVPASRLLLKHKNGHAVPVYSSHTVVNLPGQPPLLFNMAIDMSELAQTESALNIALTKYKTLFDSFPMGITVTDPAGRILETNAAAERLLGVPREIHVQRGIDGAEWQIIRPDGTPMPAEEYASVRVLKDRHRVENVEMGIVKKDCETIWISVTADLLPLPGYGAVITYGDITARREAEEQIRKLAYFDPLTGLPNRRLLMDRLSQALIASKRSHAYGALLMLDLDYFKGLNDNHGHDVGDTLLIEVAHRLTGCVRQEDTVARLGGDEYVLILEDLGVEESAATRQADQVAEKIRLSLAQPYALAGVDMPYACSASIGLTLFHNPQESVEALIKQADMALYQAKGAGRNTVRCFNPAMQSAIESRAALEEALRSAVRLNQFQLYYQPQVNQDGKPVSAEALLRWLRPDAAGAVGDVVSPAFFLPLAEETGLILPISQWVVDAACDQLKAWSESPETAHLTLAINISPRQFHQDDFVARLGTSLERSGANPARLRLELSESLMLDNIDAAIERMRALKALGVTIAMDDFGTGYSTLAYLRQLPLDQLKIDQIFVRDISTDANDAAIVRALLAMIQSLGLNVIAEGVETVAQRNFLYENGCFEYQGFLYGKPMPIDAWDGG